MNSINGFSNKEFRKFELREERGRGRQTIGTPSATVTKRDVLPKFYIRYDIQSVPYFQITLEIVDQRSTFNAHTGWRIPNATYNQG
jgi:hypothetical protein